MATRTTVLLTLAVVLLLTAGEHPVAASGQEHPRLDPAAEAIQLGNEGWLPVPAPRGGGGSTGAVEEDKAYIVGRPLFKVPPSSPCSAKAMRC